MQDGSARRRPPPRPRRHPHCCARHHHRMRYPDGTPSGSDEVLLADGRLSTRPQALRAGQARLGSGPHRDPGERREGIARRSHCPRCGGRSRLRHNQDGWRGRMERPPRQKVRGHPWLGDRRCRGRCSVGSVATTPTHPPGTPDLLRRAATAQTTGTYAQARRIPQRQHVAVAGRTGAGLSHLPLGPP